MISCGPLEKKRHGRRSVDVSKACGEEALRPDHASAGQDQRSRDGASRRGARERLDRYERKGRVKVSSRCEASLAQHQGGPLCDPAADQAFSALAVAPDGDRVVEVDATSNSPPSHGPSPRRWRVPLGTPGPTPRGRKAEAARAGPRWPAPMSKVQFVDQTIRDAQQSWGNTMRTDDIVPIAETMDKVGYFNIATVVPAFTVEVRTPG